MQLGNIEYFTVSDGVAWSDGGASFGVAPRPLWEQVAQPDSLNRVATALTCLLVRADGKTILVDSGLGDKLSERQQQQWNIAGRGRLLSSLAEIGVRPEDVDIVINTHLHSDHCGGNTKRVGEEIAAVFPRAVYWMQRRELADAAYPNERTRNTYFAENFMPLVDAGKVHLMAGNERVCPSVETMITRGHTRDHQSVVLRSQGQAALFLADAAARAVQFERLAWVPAFDVEPLESIETKRWLQSWALDYDATLIFQHDPELRLGKLHREGDRVRVERLP